MRGRGLEEARGSTGVSARGREGVDSNDSDLDTACWPCNGEGNILRCPSAKHDHAQNYNRLCAIELTCGATNAAKALCECGMCGAHCH